ncbi:hypothetical protein N7509_007992 [Penicillium cosmopolitanum]|uniref:Kinesin-like protein n=1 Tax=Penicillium cosmopolitanum TaxID=1131564 RepID=A0A9W9VZU9_9EURO|nr:uncharacterized protein N7509_007992 [Penicillium cosmopolitanum]KAJ5392502.1 hypothetical protein N7509_007992 [Penicillium cosmopolitanum]
MSEFKVWTRWRPTEGIEAPTSEIHCQSQEDESQSRSRISITSPLHAKSLLQREQWWTSGFSFDGIFQPDDSNHDVFERVVSPAIPDVLRGKSCNFFAYGHSGSGKTHTIIGYDFEHKNELGLCLASAHHLAKELSVINAQGTVFEFGIGLRIYELRKNKAIDLLNDGQECFIREGPDGRIHARGETELLENGKVRVRPIATRPCWDFGQLQDELQKGLIRRRTATSSMHDQSSRTHAIMELEVITKDLLEARIQVNERQSELVPVGKIATDIYIEEQTRAILVTADGKYVSNPDYKIDQERIDAAETKKAEFESAVQNAEECETEIFTATARVHPCLGGKLVFVDLAGAEFLSTSNTNAIKQTPLEKQQGKEINTDLLALKEVIRARSLGQSRIPYRSSPLTMLLREHFEATSDTRSAMILTVSPSGDQFGATMNTLKYGDLVGLANARSSLAPSVGQKKGQRISKKNQRPPHEILI